MAQFRVVLDGVDLSDEQHAELDRALQRTTLSFLAEVGTKRDFPAAYYLPKIIRPPLAGIWISDILEERIEGFNEALDLDSRIEELNQEIIQSAGGA